MDSAVTETLRTPAGRARPILVILGATLAAAALALASPAAAQTSDPELSCSPESVPAGGTVVCTVTGLRASSRTVLELRSASATVAETAAVASTDGRAIIDLAIARSIEAGAYTAGIAGSTVTFGITVTPAMPSSVSAGLAPSSSDLVRGPSPLLLATSVLTLTGALVHPAVTRPRRRVAPSA
jgi:hypothetical protein